MKLLSRAYILDRHNGMVLSHLANHYFWAWTRLSATASVSACALLLW